MGIIFIIIIVLLIYESNRDTKNNSSYEEFNCICPYCNRKFKLNNGYYKCECNNCFRKDDDKVLKADETVNEFTESLVKLLAFISKADGIVTQNEIDIVNQILIDNKYNTTQIKWCADLFNKTKNQTYISSVTYTISKYAKEEIEKGYILYCALKLAMADGGITSKQDEIISDILSEVKIPLTLYEKVKESVKNEYAQYDKCSKDDYYKILNINSNATKDEIKQAYKKLMKIYHPDAQSSKDLPEEIIKDITQKCIKIQEAYDTLINM